MAGLLDFVQSPEGQGLLSAAFGGMAAARRGQPINTLGAAGVSGLLGYQNAQQFQTDQAFRAQQADAMKTTNALHKLQADKLTRDLGKQQQIDDLAGKFYVPGQTAPQNALGAGAAAGDVGPTLTNQARIASSKPTAGGFDMGGYLDAVSRVDPLLGIKMVQDARKAGQVTLKPGESVWDANTRQKLYGNDPLPDMTFHPGDGYRPDLVFDKRMGFVPMPGGAPQGRPAPGGGFPPASPMPQPGPAAQAAPQAPAVRAPWDGMPPKQADEFRRQIYDNESKKLEDLRAEVAKGRGVMSDLERFGELNRGQATGGLVDRIGFLPTFDGEKREMEAITARLAPAQRTPGSGTSTDTDVRLFLSGLPGVDKTGDVNRNIREQYAANLSRTEQRLAAAERYLTQNGHLNGFEEAWRGQQGKAGTSPAQAPAPSGKVVVARGVYGGRKVLKYSDGSVGYAD